MSVDARAPSRGPEHGEDFVHEAFFYAGRHDFVDGIAAFARDAMEADEPILVMVGARKIDALRDELGRDAQHVQFANMEAVGANPARIIPAWHEFVSSRKPQCRLRGVGEPIWRGRAPEELVESQHHESLLNVAFADACGMWLVCPYDTIALDTSVIAEAHHSHPLVSTDRVGAVERSALYRDLGETVTSAFESPLPDAPPEAVSLAFGFGDLRAVRALVAQHARDGGLTDARADDFVVAANEVATNSIRHGGGRGVVSVWHDPNADAVVCELRDQGRITQPLAGRQRPQRDREGGAGLFIANHFCDLVQLRSNPSGTTVRLHMRRR